MKSINKVLFQKIILWIGLAGIIAMLISSIVLFAVPNFDTQAVYLLLTVATVAIVFGLFVFFLYRKGIFLISKTLDDNAFNISNVFASESKTGFINFDNQDEIVYVSSWLAEQGFSYFLGKNISSLNINFDENERTPFKWKIDYYESTISPQTRTIFFKQVTEIKKLQNYIETKTPAMILTKIKIASGPEVTDKIKTKINLIIFEYLSSFTTMTKSIYQDTHTTDEPHLIVAHWTKTKQFFETETNKFFNNFIRQLGVYKKFVSVSVGVSTGHLTFEELQEETKKNLKIAENRGGDQVVLQDPNGKTYYLGNSTIAAVETSRSDLKFFHSNLFTKLRRASTVLITTHVNADLDALASTYAFASHVRNEITKNVFVVAPSLDEFSTFALDYFWEKNKKIFITEQQAQKMLTSKTMLIVFDTNNTKLVQTPNLINEIDEENLFVIDHHRINEFTVQTLPKNFYLDLNASSTAEIVVDLLKLVSGDFISKEFIFESTLLLAGIYLDTNHMARHTTQKTFEAIMWLIKSGAITSMAEEWNQDKFEDSQTLVKTMLDQVEKIKQTVLFAAMPSDKSLSNAQIARLTDKLLDFKDVEAAFVIAPLESKNDYKLSARSTNSINVQKICEKYNGGGHYNAAAVLFKNLTVTEYKELINKLKSEITKTINDDKKVLKRAKLPVERKKAK